MLPCCNHHDFVNRADESRRNEEDARCALPPQRKAGAPFLMSFRRLITAALLPDRTSHGFLGSRSRRGRSNGVRGARGPPGPPEAVRRFSQAGEQMRCEDIVAAARRGSGSGGRGSELPSARPAPLECLALDSSGSRGSAAIGILAERHGPPLLPPPPPPFPPAVITGAAGEHCSSPISARMPCPTAEGGGCGVFQQDDGRRGHHARRQPLHGAALLLGTP